jgi:O-acetyl-ADP-ribose deacetylase (regulator of RNase III)
VEAYDLTPTCRLTLTRGDLTTWKGDAIVNAANERMLGGGGVDGAIHRAAGPKLLEACRAIPEISPGVRCPTGEARITRAFGALHVRWVIHTVGPIYESAAVSAPLLAACYERVLTIANRRKFARIAFPAISCGVFGYPLDEAAEVALRTARQHADDLDEVAWVLFEDAAFDAWDHAARRLGPAGS